MSQKSNDLHVNNFNILESCQTWPEDQILDEEAHAPCLLTPQPGSCRIPFGIPQPGN
jgi:hypothetical protein